MGGGGGPRFTPGFGGTIFFMAGNFGGTINWVAYEFVYPSKVCYVWICYVCMTVTPFMFSTAYETSDTVVWIVTFWEFYPFKVSAISVYWWTTWRVV